MKKGIWLTIVAAILVSMVNASATGYMAPAYANLLAMQLKASAVNNIGEVSWEAAKQIQVRRYELEKSNDGQNFTYVTAVASSSGSISMANYTAQDRNLQQGINYYRIKVIDTKGDFYYSIITVLDTKTGEKDVRILPTPVSDKLHIWLSANVTISKVTVIDAAGRKLDKKWTISNTANLANIDMRSVAPGYYSIQLLTSKGEIINQKFMKK